MHCKSMALQKQQPPLQEEAKSLQATVNLTFSTEEMLKGKLNILCSIYSSETRGKTNSKINPVPFFVRPIRDITYSPSISFTHRGSNKSEGWKDHYLKGYSLLVSCVYVVI